MFERTIHYYETDKMGVVHHSNYIRFLEEARCAWLQQIGMPFSMLEEQGVTVPVLAVNCEYKHHVTFEDTICMRVYIASYTGVRMTVGYDVTDKKTGKTVLLAETKHCFTNMELKPVNLKKYKPEFSQKLEQFMQIDK